MPNFEVARGTGAMDPPKRGGGKSLEYWNYVRWSADGDTKYIAWLTPASQLITVQLHEWIELPEQTKSGKSRYGFYIDRRDPCIGEDYDDLTDRLDVLSKRRTLGVAVELEPTYTTANGRKKVSGFNVKTETFNKTNEDGDEVEVEAPIIGIVNQARGNFYRWFASYDESYDPIEDVPFEVKRQGKGSDTSYIAVGLANVKVDYSNLLDKLQNLSQFLAPDLEVFDAIKDEKERVLAIGAEYLDRHLEYLADSERYSEQVGPINFIEDKWGNRAERKGRQAPAAVESEDDEPVEESKIDRLRREYATKK
jgi:hypothetical protein